MRTSLRPGQRKKQPMKPEPNSCGGTKKINICEHAFKSVCAVEKKNNREKKSCQPVEKCKLCDSFHPQTRCPKMFNLLKNANFAIVLHPQTRGPKIFMRLPWRQKLRWLSPSETLPYNLHSPLPTRIGFFDWLG